MSGAAGRARAGGRSDQEKAVSDDPEKVFTELIAAMGAPALGPEEMAAVLRLAKVIADASERRFAPLTCYAAGLVIGTAPEEDRLARLQDFTARVR